MSGPTNTATCSGSHPADTAVVSLSWRDDLRAALPGWAIARALVLVAWIVNAVVIDRRLGGVAPTTTDQGLFAWDGAYYRDLAELGYGRVEPGGIRFHPLVPLLARNGAGVLVLANGAGLVAAALVHRVSAMVAGDRDLARRAATLVGLAPPAFCLVWAYAEAPFLALAAGQLVALRRRWWWLAALLGGLAALTRPAGLLLALPAAVEAVSDRRVRLRAAEVAGRVAAVLGPVAGIVAFLTWAEETTGDFFAPLRVQDHLRGGFVFPPWRLLQGLGELLADPAGDALHVPFAFGAVALLWVCWRRLPASWAVLATASVLINLAADNLNSTERYAFGTVPLVVALAAITGGRWWRPTIVASSAGFVAMTTLAWYGNLVP